MTPTGVTPEPLVYRILGADPANEFVDDRYIICVGTLVPKLVTLPLESAQESLDDVGLVRADDVEGSGAVVVDQQPDPETLVILGAPVSITLGTTTTTETTIPPPTETVPGLLGRTYAEADQHLENETDDVGLKLMTGAEQTGGVVIEQSPSEGEPVDADRIVEVRLDQSDPVGFAWLLVAGVVAAVLLATGIAWIVRNKVRDKMEVQNVRKNLGLELGGLLPLAELVPSDTDDHDVTVDVTVSSDVVTATMVERPQRAGGS
ncbi:MAG TPA: PASTA domain-containing protein [Microthrixaceae bacterium]|nr:PASTA domain-containing protein [Microthrixaceae bacterium]